MSTLDARTGSLHWEAAGDEDAPGLVLVHSLGADSRMWNDQMEALTSLRRVVRMDLPGHGRSEAVDGEYTLDQLGEDVMRVASAADLDTFDMCGVSLGGLISLWAAVNHPSRVRSLIACSTAPKVGTTEMWAERMAAIRRGGLESVRDSVVPRFISEDLKDRRPDANGLVYEMFDHVDATGYLGCCAALRDADLRVEIGDITTPTLVVAGSNDVATPPEVVSQIHHEVAGSRMEVIEGAAHLVNIDRPDAFNRVIARFLSED